MTSTALKTDSILIVFVVSKYILFTFGCVGPLLLREGYSLVEVGRLLVVPALSAAEHGLQACGLCPAGAVASGLCSCSWWALELWLDSCGTQV